MHFTSIIIQEIRVHGARVKASVRCAGGGAIWIKRNEWLVEEDGTVGCSSLRSCFLGYVQRCWGARDTSLGVPGFMHCQFSNPKSPHEFGLVMPKIKRTKPRGGHGAEVAGLRVVGWQSLLLWVAVYKTAVAYSLAPQYAWF
jgi:hypothetical protein